MTLPDFLLARYAEDEAECRLQLDSGYGMYAWGANKILTDIESKRLIIKSYREALDDDEMMAEYNDGYVDGQDYALRLLALPFADHPDYEESWRP